MLKRILVLFVFFFLLNLNLTLAVSSKAVQSIDLELIKSGSIQTIGSIKEMNLSLYIPQEGLESLQISPNKWEYAEDEYGNKMVRIHWTEPKAVEEYEIKAHVINKAKHFETLPAEDWKFSEEARKETRLTAATDEIRKWAYGRETSLEKAIRLTTWINDNLIYEINPLKERTESAEWAWKARRGVCGELSNLLVAGLRSADIPTRYIAGYAVEEIPEIGVTEEKKWGHAWVEVFIDGRWVPFDPTWFEGGYLDAAHIKFANLMDSNFTEGIAYMGIGDVKWEKNPVYLKVLNYTIAKPELEVELESRVRAGDNGLVTGKVKGLCSFVRLDLRSCVDDDGDPLLDISDVSRKFWFCNQHDVYWIFHAPKNKTDYLCPVILYDQTGAEAEKNMTISDYSELKEEIFIDGPEQAKIEETFYLKADRPGLWFSPNFTEYVRAEGWELKFDRAGKYKVYFYADGQKGEKGVEVVEQKDVSFVSVENPENVTEGDWFLVNVTVRSVSTVPLPVKVKAKFQNQTMDQSFSLGPAEEKVLFFNLTAYETGRSGMLLTVESRTLSSYTVGVTVLKKEITGLPFLNWLKSMVIIFTNLIKGILALIENP